MGQAYRLACNLFLNLPQIRLPRASASPNSTSFFRPLLARGKAPQWLHLPDRKELQQSEIADSPFRYHEVGSSSSWGRDLTFIRSPEHSEWKQVMAFPTNESFVIGVDVGGTKVAAGLVDRNGKILSQTRTAMVADKDGAAGLAAVVAAIDSVSPEVSNLGKYRPTVRGIGICSPGPLDPKTGIVINPPNVPCWRNFPLAEQVAETYGVPVRVDNDANAAALAESRWGAGQGYRNIFYATIGTGIGTGILFDGRIYHGRTGAAGEGGHLSIDHRGPRCGCGKPGCVEALAAGPAIAKRARAKLREPNGHESKILDLAGGDVEAVSSEIVGRAYCEGDALAKQILDETVEFLALWLGNIIDLLDPEVLIVGGGVASMLSPVLEELHSRIPRYSVNPRCREVPLLRAHYGADSGIAGGAALCTNF